MRSLPELLVEMRRRRVFRSAVLYVVGAWIALQVADLAFESWGISNQALRNIWLGAILGFPIALILAWRYDFDGGRLIRVSQSGAETDLSLTRFDFLILVTLATLVVVIVYRLGVSVSVKQVPQEITQSGESLDQISIAVLPFASVSLDDSNTSFLALGIQDDLLTRISKISALRVISRTSVERYRNTELSTTEIGTELSVSYLVEGGIQRAGDQIRINIQLIDTLSDQHIWAESYDRDLTAAGIFSIQTEIVEAIAKQLQATLTPSESVNLAVVPTQSLDAYTAFISGKQAAQVESIQSLNESIDYFKNAIELDPDFVLAHIGLADSYLLLSAHFLGGLTAEDSIALAEPPLARAMGLSSESGEGFVTLGLLRSLKGDIQGATQAYNQAIKLAPSYSFAYRMFGRLSWQQGQHAIALEFAEKALLLDPYYAPANFDLARYNDRLGNFDEAMTRYLRIIEIKPDYAFAYIYIAAINYLVYGKVDESLIWYHKASQSDSLSPSIHAVPALAHIELNDFDGAKNWVEAGLERGPRTFWSLWSATLLNLASGDSQAAMGYAQQLLDIYPKSRHPLGILRDADIASGRFDVARSRYLFAFRELLEPEYPEVNAANYWVAVDLALVLQKLGEDDRAQDILNQALKVIESLPRMGTDGYWITDVRIFALQNRPRRALDALRTATKEGWRVLTWYYLDLDPNLESIRDLPEFIAIREEIRADLATQAIRLGELKASGEFTVSVNSR